MAQRAVLVAPIRSWRVHEAPDVDTWPFMKRVGRERTDSSCSHSSMATSLTQLRAAYERAHVALANAADALRAVGENLYYDADAALPPGAPWLVQVRNADTGRVLSCHRLSPWAARIPAHENTLDPAIDINVAVYAVPAQQPNVAERMLLAPTRVPYKTMKCLDWTTRARRLVLSPRVSLDLQWYDMSYHIIGVTLEGLPEYDDDDPPEMTKRFRALTDEVNAIPEVLAQYDNVVAWHDAFNKIYN